MTRPDPLPRSRRRWLVAAGALALALVLVEGGFRVLEGPLGIDPERIAGLRAFVVKGSGLGQPYPYTNYISRPPLLPSKVHPVQWTFHPRPKAEAPRIACLGGSTTYGTYPGFLATRLEKSLGAPVEVMNWGVPGWTSLETLVNYFDNVQDYEPDVVVLLHAINDTGARLVPGYRTDYAHWRTPWSPRRFGGLERLLIRCSDLYAALLLRGGGLDNLDNVVTRPHSGPPPADALTNGSERGFARNMRTIAEHVRLRGGHVVLTTQPYQRSTLAAELRGRMIDQHNQLMRELARREGYPLVDLEHELGEFQERFPGMFVDPIHLNDAWQDVEARLIEAAILENGWLEAWRVKGAGARDE